MIKFRGIPSRDADDIYETVDYDGTFVYGYYIKNGDSAMIVGDQTEELDDVGLSRWFEDVVPETVGQFTGLKDVNGKEIYEGDIVKWGDMVGFSHEKPVRIATVKFNPDICFDSNVGIFSYGNFAYKATDKYLTVIGNIHDNPELLEEEK